MRARADALAGCKKYTCELEELQIKRNITWRRSYVGYDWGLHQRA
jgi:hypothetical protein